MRTYYYIMCSIAYGHTPIPILMYGVRVMLLFYVKKMVFVVFIVVSYHTHIQSFSSITFPLASYVHPYYNVLPGAMCRKSLAHLRTVVGLSHKRHLSYCPALKLNYAAHLQNLKMHQCAMYSSSVPSGYYHTE